MSTAVIYACSNPDVETVDTDIQIGRCREYCSRHGLEVVGEIDDRARGNYYSPWESSKLAVTVSRVIREEADWLVVLDAPFIAIDTADFQRLRDELKGRICLAANPQKPGEWDVTSLISVDFAFNAVRKMCVWRGVVPCEFGGGGVDYE